MANFVSIKGFENKYAINKCGDVMSVQTKKLKKIFVNSWGYYTVTLYKNKKNHTFTIHRLVAQSFLPNPENKEQVNHIDGNKLNNHLSNLEWTTKSENLLHAYQKNLSKVTVQNAIESRKKIVLDLENGVFYNGLKEFAENNYLPKPYTIDNFKKTYNDKFVLV